jgi:hypothetical protein
MPLELVKLDRATDNYDNIGGIVDKIYFAPKGWFTAVGGFMTWAAAGDSAIISAVHTFSSGKGFVTLEGDFKQNSVKGKKSGEFGSHNKTFDIECMFHGLGKVASEVETMLNNQEGICLVKKLNAGAMTTYQFGLAEMWARVVDVEWDFGKPDSDKAGLKIMIQAVQPRLAIYTGDITLKT